MRGREATTELEVTEFVENEHIRIVSDTHGTIWDSVFAVNQVDGQTGLTLTMEARPYKFLPKLITPMMQGMLQKALERDMDAVKAHCEREVRL